MRYGTRNLLTAVRPSEGKGVGERIARLCDAAICTGDDIQNRNSSVSQLRRSQF